MKVFKNALEKVGNLYRKVRWEIARFFYRIEIHVYPKSPHFPSYTEVLVVFFGKFAYELEITRMEMTEEGHVDIQQIFDDYPNLHRLQVHYPDNWDNLMGHFHVSLMRQAGRKINGYREDRDK